MKMKRAIVGTLASLALVGASGCGVLPGGGGSTESEIKTVSGKTVAFGAGGPKDARLRISYHAGSAINVDTRKTVPWTSKPITLLESYTVTMAVVGQSDSDIVMCVIFVDKISVFDTTDKGSANCRIKFIPE
jgi:Mycobacterium membrane protein